MSARTRVTYPNFEHINDGCDTTTRAPSSATRGPCWRCRNGNHSVCMRIGCWGCTGPHRASGITGGAQDLSQAGANRSKLTQEWRP